MNIFDYLKSINETKEDLMLTSEDQKAYSAFMINRGLSYFSDTVAHANMMNQRWPIDVDMQYAFLLRSVPVRKRFSKWHKAEKLEDLELIKEYFGYSTERAKEALSLLSKEQIVTIRERLDKGGKYK